MKPNFDPTLELTHNGTRVEAKGPLDWETAEGHCRVEATIVQGAPGAQVRAVGRSGNYDESKTVWDAHADTNGGALQPGGATALGVLTLETDDGDVFVITWPQQVELQSA
jgi:hypothetical protein